MDGLCFRRQQPIGPYVADFFCASRKLIVELDGFSHLSAAAEARDHRRTEWLQTQGYRVIRFWNEEVKDGLEGVLEYIGEVAALPPSLPLPLKGGGNEYVERPEP